MKTLKTFAVAALALFVAASCQKPSAGDVTVTFGESSYSCWLEDGPDFDLPFTLSGDVSYPVTVVFTDVAPADESIEYSERNVDWRFIERRVVVNSAEETPVVTVHCYSPDSSVYLFKVGVESISSGSLTAAAEVEVYVDSKYNAAVGPYTVSGTLSSSAGSDPDYSETWTVMAAEDMCGFTGLLGEDAMTDEDLWPIIGATTILEGENGDFGLSMIYPMGYENYIFGAYFTIGGERTPLYAAPAFIYGGGLYGTGVDMHMSYSNGVLSLDGIGMDGELVVPYDPSSVAITYGLYSESGSFAGYTYGGTLTVDSIVRNAASSASVEPAAAPASVGPMKAILKSIDGTESLIVDMEPMETFRNIRNF